MEKYDLILVSPHLDDAVLSCGGLIAEVRKNGKKVLVVTVFSDIDTDNTSANASIFMRKCGYENFDKFHQTRINEDIKALEWLGVRAMHIGLVEADYRKADQENLTSVMNLIKEKLADKGEIYLPLAMGELTDHKLVSRIGEDLEKDFRVYYWEDYPYLMYGIEKKIKIIKGYKLEKRLDIGSVVDAKRKAIEIYKSQLKPLFEIKPMYLSNFENYYSKKIDNTDKVHYMTDELYGGAKLVNDRLIGRFNKKLGSRLVVYEQVKPNIGGFMGVTKTWIWSIMNFGKYLKNTNKTDTILTTSPNLLAAAWWMRSKNKIIYFYQADRSDPTPKDISKKIFILIFKTVEKLTIGQAERIIVSSEYIKNRMVNVFGGRTGKKIQIIPLGVDRKIYKMSGIDKVKGRIMYCGRWDKIKGVDNLVLAIEKLKKVDLLIVTSDTVAEQLGPNCRVIKPKSTAEIVGFYNQAECVVVPSINESFSLVALEALACGTIVIGTDVGEMGVLLKQIDPNLILKNNSKEEIADKIADKIDYVLGLDKNKKRDLAKRMEEVVEKYDWEKTYRGFEKILAD